MVVRTFTCKWCDRPFEAEAGDPLHDRDICPACLAAVYAEIAVLRAKRQQQAGSC